MTAWYRLNITGNNLNLWSRSGVRWMTFEGIEGYQQYLSSPREEIERWLDEVMPGRWLFYVNCHGPRDTWVEMAFRDHWAPMLFLLTWK